MLRKITVIDALSNEVKTFECNNKYSIAQLLSIASKNCMKVIKIELDGKEIWHAQTT